MDLDEYIWYAGFCLFCVYLVAAPEHDARGDARAWQVGIRMAHDTYRAFFVFPLRHLAQKAFFFYSFCFCRRHWTVVVRGGGSVVAAAAARCLCRLSFLESVVHVSKKWQRCC